MNEPFTISGKAVVTYCLCLMLILFCCMVFFRNTTLWKSAFWRRHLLWGVMANTVLFAGIAIYFYVAYGFITDDRFYFDESLWFTGNIFTAKSGTDFMILLTRPLRVFLHLDLPSCHVVFGTLGFIASLLFVLVAMARMDFKNPSFKPALFFASGRCYASRILSHGAGSSERIQSLFF